MNERIKLLAEKCWNERPEGQLHFDNEKFAELIVRECAEFARQHNLEKADRSHMIHKAIREHFGVES
jgi:hypothetical protein